MFLLQLFIAEPSPVLIMITDEMSPATVEQTQVDTDYLLGYLAREKAALGDDHPRVPCDTAEVGREISTWPLGDRDLADRLLLEAAGGAGKCQSDALVIYFSLPNR